MKAEEIRCGNWIFDGEQYQQITGIEQDRIHNKYGWCFLDIVEPIPLTPEILEKAGFEKVNHIHGYTFYSHEKSKICVYEHKTEYRGQSVYHVQFVHQLQNLYFALTSSEFPINL